MAWKRLKPETPRVGAYVDAAGGDLPAEDAGECAPLGEFHCDYCWTVNNYPRPNERVQYLPSEHVSALPPPSAGRRTTCINQKSCSATIFCVGVVTAGFIIFLALRVFIVMGQLKPAA